MKNQIKNNTLIIIGFGLIAGAIIFTGFSLSPKDGIWYQKNDNRFHEKYFIYPISLPEHISFAGENVPLTNFDTRESLDRELLINTYWQSQTLIFLKKANRYFPIIEKILKENQVPEDFKYMAVAESGMANIVSPSGATGFWQFLKGTATDYNLEVNDEVDERYDIEKSTAATARFLKDSYDKYGSWTMAAASYNMGRKNLTTQVNRQKSNHYYDLVLGEETGRYVFRLVALKIIMEDPTHFGFYLDQDDLYPPIPCETVVIDSTIENLADFAHQMGINYKVLKELNPWFRDAQLKNHSRKQYQVKIPEASIRPIPLNPNFFSDDSIPDQE